MKANIVDLRYRMKSVMAALNRSETITVLHRGREKARLTPVTAPVSKRKSSEDPAFGMWSGKNELGDVAAHVRKLRRRRFDDI